MTLADFSGEWSWLLVLFGFLLAIANKLLMRRPTAYRAAEIVVTNPDYGFTDEGTKLTQIFTILALTQSAGITFYRA